MREDKMFLIPELTTLEAHVKLCYGFLTAPYFFHQELGVMNPFPEQYNSELVLPGLYLAGYHADSDKVLPSLSELMELVQAYDAPMSCVGSHLPEVDRTLQFFSLPGPDGKRILLGQTIGRITLRKTEEIKDMLLQAVQDTIA